MQFSLGKHKRVKKESSRAAPAEAALDSRQTRASPISGPGWLVFTHCAWLPPAFSPAPASPPPSDAACLCRKRVGAEPGREAGGERLFLRSARERAVTSLQEDSHTEAEALLFFSEIIFIKILSEVVDRNPVLNLSIIKVICIYVQIYMWVFYSAE